MPNREYTNPVHPGYLADPFVWREGGEYFAIGTGPADAAGQAATAASPTIFPLLRSNNLASWQAVGPALVRPDPALGDTFWAPEVVRAEGRWWLYYSVGQADRDHQLRVASSEHPLGPYVDAAQLTSPADVPFAIDPHPFRDSDGRWYLFHARDYLDEADDAGLPVRSGTALAVQALESMTRLAPGPARTVARARHHWQRFAAGRRMYGREYDWHTLEGPFVVLHEANYYCLYSAGCWQAPSYGVDYVTAQSVMGPYADDANDRGPRVLASVPGHVLGPGHCSVTLGPDGKTHYLAYHAWDTGATARRLCIDELRFTPAGPRSPGPTWTPQQLAAAGAVA